MTGMGAHSHPNGHRGEDGAAAVAALEPAAISTALSPQRLIPFSLQWAAPQQDAPATATGERQVSRWRDARRVMSAHRAWLAAVPVILVNAVAFAGQLGFLRGHLPWPLYGQVLVAVTLESVAVYLAWQAHLALAADDSALRLRLAAYAFAAVIGAMNFSHYAAPHWRPTFAAVTFGLMSVSSPWLWSVHSRRVSRDALKERGLIEPHAVRLGGTRWAWHPFRSVRVMSHATWTGETDPAAAIAAWQPRKARRAPETPADASGIASRAADVSAPPDAPERHRESVSDERGTVSAPASRDAKPKPRTAAPPPSARVRALAVLKANPGLEDAEVMKRAKVSRASVTRARRELAKP